MPSSVALALDAVPLGDALRRPVDYDARLVAEACVGTLCQEAPGEPDPQPHAALGLRPLNGGLRWRLAPDSQARWSNGLPLLPTHVVAGIRDAAAKDRQLGRFLRPCDEAAAETPDGSVELRLTAPTGFLPALLTLPQLAPLRPGCDAVLGLYAPAGTGPSGGPRLVRHEHTGPEGLPDELRFPVFKDLAGAVSALPRRHHRRDPHHELRHTRRRASGRRPRPHGTPGGALRQPRVRQTLPTPARRPGLRAAIARALDPAALAAPTNGLLEPAPAPAAALAGFPLADALPPVPPDAHDVGTVRAALSEQPYAEVAYADFVPSETVVQQICAQLHAVFGLHFRPRALSYQQYGFAALRGEAVAWSLTTAVPGCPASGRHRPIW